MVDGTDDWQGRRGCRSARHGMRSAHLHAASALSSAWRAVDPGEPGDLRVAHLEALRAASASPGCHLAGGPHVRLWGGFQEAYGDRRHAAH
eukprot:8120729-Heterocapsa_arctica.AAC.1